MRTVLACLVLGSVAALVSMGCSQAPPPDFKPNQGQVPTTVLYPAGPYGMGKGSVIQNLQFIGYANPSVGTVADKSLDFAAYDAWKPPTELSSLAASMWWWSEDIVRNTHSWQGKDKPNPGITRPLARYAERLVSHDVALRVLARARAVAVYLNSKLDNVRFRLAYVGRGPANPRAANDTPEHMALNRRVEIKVPQPQT